MVENVVTAGCFPGILPYILEIGLGMQGSGIGC